MFDDDILLDSDNNLVNPDDIPVLVAYDSSDPVQSKEYMKMLLNFFGERTADDEIRMYHELDTVYLLKSEGVYKGFIVYRTATAKVMYVRLLGILTKYRRSGLGKEMLNLFVDQVKKEGKYTTLQLNVNGDNSAAVRLYDSIGFKTIMKAEVRRMEFKI